MTEWKEVISKGFGVIEKDMTMDNVLFNQVCLECKWMNVKKLISLRFYSIILLWSWSEVITICIKLESLLNCD